MSELERVQRRLERFEPTLVPGRRRAGVAMLLRDLGARPEVLFIERARMEGDPWSGHMAFPGGKVDPGDADSRAAAERETLEEVEISLAPARLLGRLHDLQGRGGGPGGLVVSGYVYHLPHAVEPRPNYEVEESFWFPLWDLLDPDLHVEHRFPSRAGGAYPGVVVGDPERHVVWGLTYRFLQSFFEALGEPFPPGSPGSKAGQPRTGSGG